MPDKNDMEINVDLVYRQYGPMVLRRCRAILKDEDKALDAMQEIFVKVMLKREQLKNEYPSSLLYRMATNHCLNVIRDEHRDRFSDDEDVLVNIAMYDETEETTIAGNLLDHIFKREKRSTREIAVMLFVDGMTLKEVAGETGLSVSGVRKRIRELRARVDVSRAAYGIL